MTLKELIHKQLLLNPNPLANTLGLKIQESPYCPQDKMYMLDRKMIIPTGQWALVYTPTFQNDGPDVDGYDVNLDLRIETPPSFVWKDGKLVEEKEEEE
jgi:hypothetical protein